MTPAGKKTLPSLAKNSFKPDQWITDAIKDIKMQYASQLLSKGATIQETIMAIGYKDYKNFVSNFKDTFNKSPMEWIKEDDSNHEG